jgi:very-short-patch-repair endonuclease
MSTLEETFALHIRAESLPTPVREYVFAKPRGWRFDFAWPTQRLAVEIEGGVWTQGRHTRGAGFVADMEKYNAATLLGWRVLRFHGDAVQSGAAIRAIIPIIQAERA